jgi:hypothetical protein
MSKKLLYLEDLYNFYLHNNQSVHYSLKEDKQPLYVQTHGKLVYKKKEETKDTLLSPVRLLACHTGINRNGSSISEEVMEKALPSFANKPILAYIHNVDDKDQFAGHEMHMEGEDIVYDEIPVGIIPESNGAKLVWDEDKQRSYVEIGGYIFNEYSKAKDILEREGECSVSVELNVVDMSFDANERALRINEFLFSGVTILGVDEYGDEVKPGMEGSNIHLSDFSEHQTIDFSEKIIEMQKEIEDLRKHFDDIEQSSAHESLEKGGTEMQVEENVQMEVTEEQPEVTEQAEVTENQNEEGTSEETPEENVAEEPETTEDQPEVTVEESIEQNEAPATREYSLSVDGNVVSKFDVSINDIAYSLSNLVNSMYSEQDNDYYFVDAYPDEKYVVMQGWYSNRAYKQSYTCEDEIFSLVGDRVEVYASWLTAEEKEELADMRANYSALEQFKADTEAHEAHVQREAVMAAEKYAVVSAKNAEGAFENASYADLYANMDQYSCEELDQKLMAIVGEYAINGGKFSVAEEPKKQPKVKLFADASKKNRTSKYGTLKF